MFRLETRIGDNVLVEIRDASPKYAVLGKIRDALRHLAEAGACLFQSPAASDGSGTMRISRQISVPRLSFRKTMPTTKQSEVTAKG